MRIVLLPAIAAPFVEWPWPGNADAAEAAPLDRAMDDHYRCCGYCRSAPGFTGDRQRFAMGCRWAGYIQAARIRTATRGEGGETVPVVIGRPRRAS